MCRLLLIKTNKIQSQTNLLMEFAQMCKKSKAPDGDWQGDGFGITWLNYNNSWETIKSTLPIWEKPEIINEVPNTNIVLVHARSATFKNQLNVGDTSFNQPFSDDKYAYIFNGHLEGVKLKFPVRGKTGAEKLWNLLNIKLTYTQPIIALNELLQERVLDTNKIYAMNIGLSDKKNIYALCKYLPNEIIPDYHKLHYYSNDKIKLIVSEPIGGFNYSKALNPEIIIL
jgi:predicted glutamine amidotransferase